MFGRLLLFFACLYTGTAVRPPIATIDYTVYHHVDDLISTLGEIVEKNPDTMKFENHQASEGNYSATVMDITSEQSGLSSVHDDKLRVLMSFGQHGRELITTEVALRFVEALQDEAKMKSLLGPGARFDRLNVLLDRIVLKILPVENYNGRKHVEDGDLCERKNGRGVDPNRNWDVDFGVKESDYDPKEEYPGKHPFSEPEAQIVLGIAEEFQPHVWVNVHSGMWAMFMPYDHKGEIPEGMEAEQQFELLKQLQASACKKCEIGSGGKTVGYLAHGTATDYMYVKLGVPLAFTWEIYGAKASHADCFRGFNPVTRDVFEEVTSQWTNTLFTLLELLPTHPSLEHYGLRLPSGHMDKASSMYLGRMRSSVQFKGYQNGRVVRMEEYAINGAQTWPLYGVGILIVGTIVGMMMYRRQRLAMSRSNRDR